MKLFPFARLEAWESFPMLPGEHLRWRRTARGVSEIVTQDGRVLATVEGLLSLFATWPLYPVPPRCVTIDHLTYRVEGRLGGSYGNVRVITPEGLTVLSFAGTKNFNRQATSVIQMPDGQSLRFPVFGTWQGNAVMVATDDAGSPVFQLRQVRREKVVEILVEPGRQITPELLLAIATGQHNLANFFDRPRGGG